MYYSFFSDIVGLSLRDAIALPARNENQSVSRHCKMFPGGQTPSTGNHCARGQLSPEVYTGFWTW